MQEVQAPWENHTWDIVTCLTNIRAIGCKQVDSIKLWAEAHMTNIKQGWQHSIIEKSMEWTMRKHLPLEKMSTMRFGLAIAASMVQSLR